MIIFGHRLTILISLGDKGDNWICGCNDWDLLTIAVCKKHLRGKEAIDFFMQRTDVTDTGSSNFARCSVEADRILDFNSVMTT